ncbi:hypothetical protein DFJ74DRAFT_641680 [Hyaloraphidium curvatum]|nr:hypothetical protein DFJ74DRAFT_641680 [Hyaloraphidium curvatum]
MAPFPLSPPASPSPRLATPPTPPPVPFLLGDPRRPALQIPDPVHASPRKRSRGMPRGKGRVGKKKPGWKERQRRRRGALEAAAPVGTSDDGNDGPPAAAGKGDDGIFWGSEGAPAPIDEEEEMTAAEFEVFLTNSPPMNPLPRPARTTGRERVFVPPPILVSGSFPAPALSDPIAAVNWRNRAYNTNTDEFAAFVRRMNEEHGVGGWMIRQG